MASLFIAQATPIPEASSPPETENTRDVYTQCFLREMSLLEGVEFGRSNRRFSRNNAITALRRCREARVRLLNEIERDLAADPVYEDRKLRSIELENRVALRELPLLLLIQSMGE
ncbi:MAG: hypothetical protein ACT4OE_08795 [Sphingosinicella sp.]